MSNKERLSMISEAMNGVQTLKARIYAVASDLSNAGITGPEGELVKALEFLNFAQKRLDDARERLA